MKKAYFIYGMKRSGHHAIVHWIAYNHLSAIHFNDCRFNSKLQDIDQDIRLKGRITYFGDAEKSHKSSVYIYNFEDKLPNVEFVNKSKTGNLFTESYHILVVRDPANWLASCLKVGGGIVKRINPRIKTYKTQIKKIKSINTKDSNLFSISFNDWFANDNLRKKLGIELNMPRVDLGLNKTSPRGGGSSFDKMKYRNKAQDMKVLERWKHYENDSLFKVLMDREMLDIQGTMFKGVGYGINSTK